MIRFIFPIFLLPLCSLANGELTVINTIAGIGAAGSSGDNGPAISAELYTPSGVSLDSFGNVYIADTQNNRIRKVDTSGTITTVAGGGCCGSGYGGDGGPATLALLYGPSSVAVDASGNIYIADMWNQVVRKVADGNITTFAGTPLRGGYSGDGGPAVNALLLLPQAVSVDLAGNVFVADQNHVIRRIDASTGNISRFAGNGQSGYAGDGGPATQAPFCQILGLAVDSSDNVFIVDSCNQRVREVSSATGNITSIAGNGTAGYTGDGGPATAAQLYNPTGIAVTSSGDIFIDDTYHSVIRKISAGIITTAAGTGGAGYFGDGGVSTFAALYKPTGVAANDSGEFFIADTGNNRIRKASPTASIPTEIAPGGVVPVCSKRSSIQRGEWISIYGVGLGPTTPVTWNGDFPTQLANTSVTVDGIPAYLWYVSSSQINLQVPDIPTAYQPVPVTVFVGSKSSTTFVPVVSVAPSFSLLDATHVAGIIVHSDGTYDVIGPTGNSLGYATVAAKDGDNIALFGVGFGPTTPTVPSGQPFSGAAATTNSVTLSINGNNVIPTFAGLSSAGLYQINLTVPAGVGTGDVPLVATVAGVSTQTGVVISLQ